MVLQRGRRYLGDDDVAVGRSAFSNETVQDELWHLSGFTAARRPPDDHHRAGVQRRHDLVLKLFDRQQVALLQDLWPQEVTLQQQQAEEQEQKQEQHEGKEEEEQQEEKREQPKEQLTDLLQVVVVLQLEHELVLQVAADLPRSALRARRVMSLQTLQTGRGRGMPTPSGRLTKASGPSSMLLLVHGFQLTCGGDQGTTPPPL